jgi:predicted metalloprotease with PDZ domain
MMFRAFKTFSLLSLLTLSLLAIRAEAQVGEIEYSVHTDRLKNHELEVLAKFPAGVFPDGKRELALAVWTPGSYKVRDYSRFLSSVEVLNPGTTIRKTSKNRWLIEGLDKAADLKVRYTVHGHDLTVRTNYFTPELTLIVGAATFLAPAPLQSEHMSDATYKVTFEDWNSGISTGLEAVDVRTFAARDYDELVDCPFVLGDLQIHDFPAGDSKHRLIQAGDPQYWDTVKSLKDAAQLVDTTQKFWGIVPYDRYLFHNLITDTRGGLEHRNSTVVMTNRFTTDDREAYLGWLSLLSHEFFHTWNVKRLRPKSLGPFDYEQEVYTRSLWVAEGITSYYDELLVRRAGLSTRREYLKSLSKQLNRLLTTPGRKQITLADASFDSWIRLYQPTDDLHNSNVSYYNKGSLVAWLLDTEVRRRTKDKKSLDDVMRRAYGTFLKTGYSEQDFRALVSEVAGSDFSDFFTRTLDSTSELPLDDALEYWNLEWSPDSEKEAPYLGIEVDSAHSRAVVTTVFMGSPAFEAGIAPGDEIIAVDGLRLPADAPLSILKHLKADKKKRTILLSRLGRLHTRSVTLAAPPHRESQLTFGRSDQRSEKRWSAWLGPERREDS